MNNKDRISLPQKAIQTLSILEEKECGLDNLYLNHYRYFKWDRQRHNKKPESLLRNKCIKENNGRITGITSIICDKKCDKFKLQPLLERLNIRTEELATLWENRITPYSYKPLNKLAIGIGEASPWDSLLLMTLHPLYGVPYLPATAIKGMLRGYWEQEDGGKVEAEEIFGNTDEMGKLIFFDIFPNEFTIDFDVMTPHYGSYYSEGKEPTDDNDPNIITFPVVKNACFNIQIAWRCEKTFKNYSTKLDDNLKKALQLYGIGAKTALGYGLSE